MRLRMANSSGTNSDVMASTEGPFIPDSIASHDMAISNFSQVIFPDIPDFYPPESDIDVTYILTEVIKPSSRDWVGLFRVGWSSPRDYSTYIWVPRPQNVETNENRTLKITFQAYQLPGDDKEFYQFCYVTNQGYVRGASTPFQFRLCTENDCLVEVEDESGMIILKTKSDALEEQLDKVNVEKQALQQEMDELNKSKEDLHEELKKLSTEIAETQQQCKEKEETNKELQSKFDDLQQQHEKITARLAKADSRIEKTKTDLVSAEETIVKLTADVKMLEEKMQTMLVEQSAHEQKYKNEINQRDLKIQENQRDMNGLLDQMKSLSLVKEEAQKKSSSSLIEHEEKLRGAMKIKDELSVKMQRFKDERNLFKDQFMNSEMTRQETMQNIEDLTKKMKQKDDEIASFQQEIEAKDKKVVEVTKQLEQLNQKHKHEMNKYDDLLRNSLERGNATNTAKQLLAEELSEVTGTRDGMLVELNKIKREKELLTEEMRGFKSTIHALQSQLETAEEKLSLNEIRLIENEKLVMDERRKAEGVEREMHESILLLRQQLEDADNAVAMAANVTETASSTSLSRSMKNQRTQTKQAKCNNSEVQTLQETKKPSSESEVVINDLTNQVHDLTTRLSMGADAYKEKFVECHRLEKKLKKLKQLYHAKQIASKSSAATSSVATGTGEEGEQQQTGWGSKLEKLFMAIADPDAEDKEQEKQLQLKLENLQKNVESEHARYRRYKQLYTEEKQKLVSVTTAKEEREADLSQALDVADSERKTLRDENDMLKAQLKEFVQSSTDSTVKNAMTYQSTDELSSSPDERNAQFGNPRELGDDEPFQDAPGFPMYDTSYKYPGSSDQSQSASSELSDDTGDYAIGRGGARFTNFNMCSESTRDAAITSGNTGDVISVKGPPTTSRPVTIAVPRKSKVISRQPIRSPPLISEIITSPRPAPQSSQSAGTSHPTEARKRNGKGTRQKKSKSRKSVKGVM